MAKDRRLSVRMTVEETGLAKNTVNRILTDHLHMRKICAKLVPKNLPVEQKANRLEICQYLLGSTGAIYWQGKTVCSERSVPAALCPPQIPRAVARNRTWDAAVRHRPDYCCYHVAVVEAAVANAVLPPYLCLRTAENQEKRRTAGVPAKSRTGHLQNTSLQCCPYTKLLGSFNINPLNTKRICLL